MLVLTRKPGQAITIGGNIELVVVEVKGDQVRLGITAPREVAIHRKEVYEQVRLENVLAAEMDASTPEEISKLLGSEPKQQNPEKNG